MAQDQDANFSQDATETRMTAYMGFVSFMILVWDHAITFADEVEYIWKGKKGIYVILFAINRYLTPLSFIVNLFAYLSPSWTYERCRHFVRYEGAMIVIAINTTALMMLLRISAIYNGRPLIIGLVAVAFCIEFSVNAWLVSHGVPVHHEGDIHACTMIFDPAEVGGIASASAWMPLLYDTLVLALTLNRTLGPVRNKTTSKIAKVLLRDGILYYTVIFAVNLVLTLMIATAPPGLQNITAQLEQMLTVTMMSRITLHLREQAQLRDSVVIATLSSPRHSTMPSRVRFTLPGSEAPSPAPAGISVEETTVTHDDRGHLLGGPRYTKKGGATEEWYEMASPPMAHVVDPRRSWLSRTPKDDLQYRFSP